MINMVELLNPIRESLNKNNLQVIESIVKRNKLLQTTKNKNFISMLKRISKDSNEEILTIIEDKEFMNILTLHICLCENNNSVENFRNKYLSIYLKTPMADVFDIDDSVSDDELEEFIIYLEAVVDLLQNELGLESEVYEVFKEKYEESESYVIRAFAEADEGELFLHGSKENDSDEGGFLDGVCTFLKYALPVAIGAGVGYYVGKKFINEDDVTEFLENESSEGTFFREY